MPWYLVEASHGPGHQSHTSKMCWSDSNLDKKGLGELWDSVFDKYDYDWPIGNCIKLKGLTENRIAYLRKSYCSRIEACSKMLDVLENTLVIPHSIIKNRVCSCGERCYTCTRCGKTLCYAFPIRYGWCPDCQLCQGGEHEWSKKPPIVCVKCGVEHPFEKNWKRHRTAK